MHSVPKRGQSQRLTSRPVTGQGRVHTLMFSRTTRRLLPSRRRLKTPACAPIRARHPPCSRTKTFYRQHSPFIRWKHVTLQKCVACVVRLTISSRIKDGSRSRLPIFPVPQPVYAGEDNTVHGGINAATVTSVSLKAVTEAFDEPLTLAQVLTIVKPFIV